MSDSNDKRLRIYITLTKAEMIALYAFSDKELRSPQLQVSFIVRQELQKQGFIKQPQPILAEETPLAESQNGEQNDRSKKSNNVDGPFVLGVIIIAAMLCYFGTLLYAAISLIVK